jgi:type I restriction enzyme M protein
MPKEKKTSPPQTTSQSLGSLLKSARDIMRKDKGLNGDLDRLPMLTWIMFLKFLDDLEIQREEEAKLSGKKFKPAIEAPYRWRDWAANQEGLTGDELLAFINQEEAVLPTGKKGTGLFRYLRQLTSSNGDNRRDVIATVFRGVQNRMINGYLLRDLVNKVAGIHFTSSSELHTLGSLYESMLREMRDAAGDSGEFYTPRAVVRFMVEVTDPRLGETILDPACGTGGFLVEAFNHLSKQVKTVADRKILQEKSIFGCEAKSLPYLLAQMNLLLHGLDAPQIDPGNALRFKLTEIGERDRVDVILTNPPFGGEEERGIQNNFPGDKQTSETALLFLQLIMRKLRRQGGKARAAVVVPHGTLSAPGVAVRIREELLRDFNLRAIIRLPHNVFAPYTDIQTNILFFDRTGRTTSIQYCEPILPDGTTLSKTKPLRYEWLLPYREAARNGTKEGDDSWRVDISNLTADLNLDIKNPKIQLSSYAQSGVSILNLSASFGKVSQETAELRHEMAAISQLISTVPKRRVGEFSEESDERIGDRYNDGIKLLGVSREAGFCTPKTSVGKHPGKYKIIREGYLAYNPMRINIGSIGVSMGLDEIGITSPDYVVIKCRDGLLPEYLYHYLRSEAGRHEIKQKTKGSVRFRLYFDQLAQLPIPVPQDLELQARFARVCRKLESIKRLTATLTGHVESVIDSFRREAFLKDG